MYYRTLRYESDKCYTDIKNYYMSVTFTIIKILTQDIKILYVFYFESLNLSEL